MININLLPEQLKKKKRKILFDITQVPQEIFFGLVGGLVVILILIHLILMLGLVVKKAQDNSLNKSWSKILPEKKQADSIIEENKELETKINSIERIITNRKISWAGKLNLLSDYLPTGVWLTHLTLSDRQFIVEGSAVSKKRQEMINVGKFVSDLKNNPAFSFGLKDIELTSIKRRLIKDVEVVDFMMISSIIN